MGTKHKKGSGLGSALFTRTQRQILGLLFTNLEKSFYVSVAKSTDHATSDIDVLIVSDHLAYGDIMSVLPELESKLGRTVNPTLYRKTEFKKKIDTDSSFVKKIMEQPKIFLYGISVPASHSRVGS